MAYAVVASKRDGQQAALALPASTCAQHLDVVCCALLKQLMMSCTVLLVLAIPAACYKLNRTPPAFKGRRRSGMCAALRAQLCAAAGWPGAAESERCGGGRPGTVCEQALRAAAAAVAAAAVAAAAAHPQTDVSRP